MSTASPENGHGAFLPIGSIVMWGGAAATAPAGWLICDGSPYKTEQYPDLFAAIGHNFGGRLQGGLGQDRDFYVPDLRGRFVRGVDTTAPDKMRDPDRATRTSMRSPDIVGPVVGSLQEDATRVHTHTYSMAHGSEGRGLFGGSHWSPRDKETGATGGSETRPVNAYLFFIIKAQ